MKESNSYNYGLVIVATSETNGAFTAIQDIGVCKLVVNCWTESIRRNKYNLLNCYGKSVCI